jgi:DNA-binding transcriptional ArsR family regulator
MKEDRENQTVEAGRQRFHRSEESAGESRERHFTMIDIDRVIHEPARLRILMVLSVVQWADFPSLCRMLGLTRGNLSAHIRCLERSRYVQVKKSIVGRVPHTQYRLKAKGERALAEYWAAMDEIRGLGTSESGTEE